MRLMRNFVVCPIIQVSGTLNTEFPLYRNGQVASIRKCNKIFVGVLIGAVQPALLRTAVAVIDFIYYTQLHVHTSKILEEWEKMIKVFHEHTGRGPTLYRIS